MNLVNVTWRKSTRSSEENCIEVARLTSTAPPTEWRKSSYSGANDDNCVETARLGITVGLRDSKNPDAGHLTIPAETFTALLTHIKHDPTT